MSTVAIEARQNPKALETIVKLARWTLLWSFLLLTQACKEDFESHYGSFEEAHKADAGHGWLPEFLPSTATNIREIHNLDSNRVWGSFVNVAGASVTSFCLNSSTLSGVHVDDPGATWWPKELVGDINSSAHAWNLYECSGSPHSILIAPTNGRQFYWVSLPR
jgi:hypothetical protein